MAETKKPKPASSAGGDVFDVAKPGKSAPSASAKPIIVTNRPVLKDPMVVDDNAAPEKDTDEPAKVLSAPSAGKLKLAPLTPELKTVDAADTTADADDTAQTADAEPKETPTEDASDDDAEPSMAADADSDPALPKAGSAKDDEAAKKAEADRQAELDKLTESRKYYLPINQVEKRRAKHYVIFGFIAIILLGLVWADVALDAGLITIHGVKAPTHLFK